MTRTMLTLLVLLALPLMAIAGDPGEMSPEEQQAAMAEYMKLMTPTENHRHLDEMVGTWKTTSSVWMGGPGSEPMTTEGTSVKAWILGDRYLEEKTTGTMMGMPMEGRGLAGYDNVRNLYTQVWCDNLGTQFWIAEGSRNPETGRFTFYGKMDEPMLSVYGRTVKATYTIESHDRHVFTMVDLHAADDYKVFEVVYERVK